MFTFAKKVFLPKMEFLTVDGQFVVHHDHIRGIGEAEMSEAFIAVFTEFIESDT